jgi:hypothetical protein
METVARCPSAGSFPLDPIRVNLIGVRVDEKGVSMVQGLNEILTKDRLRGDGKDLAPAEAQDMAPKGHPI